MRMAGIWSALYGFAAPFFSAFDAFEREKRAASRKVAARDKVSGKECGN